MYATRGRLRLFNMTKQAEDSIQDDLYQWVQETGLPGVHRLIEDRLFARQALINTFWVGYDYRTIGGGVQLSNKLKHEVVRQGEKGEAAGLEDSRFFGLVNKIDFTRAFGRLTVRPKFKSELLLDNTPYSMGGVAGERQEWTRMFILTFSVPVLNHTRLQWGVEQLFLSDYERDEDLLVRGDLTGDSSSTVLAAQLTNLSTFSGYAMTTLFGYSVRHSLLPRVDMKDRSVTDSTLFLTVYAGLFRIELPFGRPVPCEYHRPKGVWCNAFPFLERILSRNEEMRPPQLTRLSDTTKGFLARAPCPRGPRNRFRWFPARSRVRRIDCVPVGKFALSECHPVPRWT